ncbi:MAG: hypothetical protein WD271_17030 [Acidimicrobiia bacterium]
MKVLVATHAGQGDLPDDYCWTTDGELAHLLDCPDPLCGCSAFGGFESLRARRRRRRSARAVQGGVSMTRAGEIRFPESDAEPDPAWWRPLELVAFRVAADRSLPALDIDAFMFMGRLDRGRRSSIWFYKHVMTRCYLNIDAEATLYRFRPPRDLDNPRSNGSYVAQPSLKRALRAADLHVLAPSGQWLVDPYPVPDVPTEPVRTETRLRLIQA